MTTTPRQVLFSPNRRRLTGRLSRGTRSPSQHRGVREVGAERGKEHPLRRHAEVCTAPLRWGGDAGRIVGSVGGMLRLRPAMRPFAVAPILVALVALFGPLSGARGATLDRQHRSGRHAAVVAQGAISHPAALGVAVAAKPRQRVLVSITAICRQSDTIRATTGDLTLRGKSTTTVPLPIAVPDSCGVGVVARLAG